jgi:chromate transporter
MLVALAWFRQSHWWGVMLESLNFGWLRTQTLPALAWLSLKLGAFTFGGGYVMVPLMKHHVVDTFQWLSPREFSDGMALGQLTPGPFVITVTFIGYRVAGLTGAILATLGIFFVPFWVTIWAARSLEKFRQNIWVQGALSGVTPTAIALLGAAAVSLVRSALGGPPISWVVVLALVVTSCIIFIKYPINPLFILAVSASIGWFFAG